jgi:hypothetical protein
MIVIFHNGIADNQAETYEFFMNHMEVGAEFVLTGNFAAIQSVTGSCTASSGDTDGLSAVLYAPSTATGISTYLNLGAVHTTLYTAPTSLALQNMGSGIANDKDIDNAYLSLCMNSTNWSGDYGVIKRLGDKDWEIVTMIIITAHGAGMHILIQKPVV